MVAKPANEIEDIGIAPHPGRKSSESVQGVDGFGILGTAADVLVDPNCVRPVGYDGNSGKSFFADKPLRDLRPFPVKLVRAVRCRADQDVVCVTNKLKESIVVVGSAAQRLPGVAQRALLRISCESSGMVAVFMIAFFLMIELTPLSRS